MTPSAIPKTSAKAVVGLEAGAADLAVEDFELVAQDHYLKCLGISRALAPDDESQDRADDQIEEKKQRELLVCATDRRGGTLRRLSLGRPHRPSRTSDRVFVPLTLVAGNGVVPSWWQATFRPDR